MSFNRGSLRKNRRKSFERGSSLVEFAIAAPLLLTLLLGVFDLSRAINQYMVLSQIAGEGVRSASERAGLEAGTNFVDLSTPGDSPGHYNVQSRVNNILLMQHLKINNLSIASSYSPQPDPTTGQGGRTVSVTISGMYHGIFPLFKNLQIKAQKSGPYLF